MVSVADGAAIFATTRGETTADALRILAHAGRRAMSEFRRVLGVLREAQGHERLLGPQPGIRDLDPLLTRVRAAGLPVTYRATGDLDALGSGVQLTVYRIVQEALTNTSNTPARTPRPTPPSPRTPTPCASRSPTPAWSASANGPPCTAASSPSAGVPSATAGSSTSS
ncbi:hypothetical protein [Streptomyces sviceus]|uniref:hypothetical protein n=1 Tax=Streptomyces sviceus TaxID=285530 RepID=UPI003318D7B8